MSLQCQSCNQNKKGGNQNSPAGLKRQQEKKIPQPSLLSMTPSCLPSSPAWCSLSYQPGFAASLGALEFWAFLVPLRKCALTRSPSKTSACTHTVTQHFWLSKKLALYNLVRNFSFSKQNVTGTARLDLSGGLAVSDSPQHRRLQQKM